MRGGKLGGYIWCWRGVLRTWGVSKVCACVLMYIQYSAIACACLSALGTVESITDDDNGRVEVTLCSVLFERPAMALATFCCIVLLSAEATASADMLDRIVDAKDEVPRVGCKLLL